MAISSFQEEKGLQLTENRSFNYTENSLAQNRQLH